MSQVVLRSGITVVFSEGGDLGQQTDQMQNILQGLDALAEKGVASGPACLQLLGDLYILTKSAGGLKSASSLSKSHIAVLGYYGFKSHEPEVRSSALRSLNNILVLVPSKTRLFADAGLPALAIERLKSTNQDDEFLAARLLLLCSAHATEDSKPYIEQGGLAQALNTNIARYAETPGLDHTPACGANIQLLTVIAAKYEGQAHILVHSLDPILNIFARTPIQPPLHQHLLSLLIDSLAVLPFHDEASRTSGRPWPPFNEDKLVELLDLTILSDQHEDPEAHIIPLVTLLYRITCSGPVESKDRLRAHLLPSDHDRTQPLGRGDSLPHRLVKISTETVTPELKKMLALLLLALSDDDPIQLVHSVGFGCGVGLLRALGIPAPVSGDSHIDQITGGTVDVNPVTGQRRDRELQQSGFPEMTEEEKEREAERLFVLFERLRATGVVDVENPVSASMKTGQVQELDSDEDDE